MTDDTRLHRLYNRARLDDREVNEMIGLAHGITADGVVTQDEVNVLHKWLVAHTAGACNPVVKILLDCIDALLADGVVEPEEAKDIFLVLQQFSAGDFELGETLKSTTPPLDKAPRRCISCPGAVQHNIVKRVSRRRSPPLLVEFTLRYGLRAAIHAIQRVAHDSAR